MTDIKTAFDQSEDVRVQFFVAEMHRLCRSLSAVPDPARGYALMKNLADAGDMTALALMGLRYREGNGTDADPARAVDAIQRSAEAGNALGLALLGDVYELGLGPVSQDRAAALASYEQAGEKGQVDSLDRLSKIYAGEVAGFSANTAELKKTIDALCARGGCGGLAAALNNTEETRNSSLMRTVSGYLCENEDSWCVRYSYILENGVAGPVDAPGALKAAEKACRGGDKGGCVNATIFANSAKAGRRQNLPLAREMAQKGCDLDELRLCAELGRMLYLGEGGPTDVESARRYMKKACDGDNAFGCHLLGVTHQSPDSDEARRLKAKACRLGRQEACE